MEADGESGAARATTRGRAGKGHGTEDAPEDGGVSASDEGERLEESGWKGVGVEFREVVVEHGVANRHAGAAELRRDLAGDDEGDGPGGCVQAAAGWWSLN